jgi:NADH:ubiquinone oxidoreductase subunit E
VECLGACEGAPMMQVNDGYFHVNLTTEGVDGILDGLLKEAAE